MAQSTQGARVPGLDGLRGVAIILVMFYHMTVISPMNALESLWHALASHGDCGVDLFFVISGFLITGILWETKSQPGYFRNFFARRALRILPLYYAVLAFAQFVLPRIYQGRAEKFAAVQNQMWMYWLHLSNFAVAERGKFVHGVLDVAWSLAIEEQFYVFWPFVILLFGRRTLLGISWALLLISIGSRVTLSQLGFNPVQLYVWTFCRLDGLALGAIIALTLRGPNPLRWASAWRFTGIHALSLAAVLLFFAPKSELFRSSVAFAGAAVVYFLAVGAAPGWLARSLESRGFTRFGIYSYAIYLFHYPVLAAVRDLLYTPLVVRGWISVPLLGQFGLYFVGFTLSYWAAWLSWWGYERHFLKLKRYFECKQEL